MKKVLVTGADGFIGSHLAEALVRRGHQVRALVCYNAFGSWGWLDQAPDDVKSGMEVVLGDVRDPHGVKKSLAGCDAVMHLAALIGIPYSYHSPDSYVETNIGGTLNVLQAARELGTALVVHTSTSEVYGTARSVPITEDHPLQGQSPYSASKIGADQMALSFHASFDTPVAVLRPFNTYGPRQSMRAVIPTIMSQVASGLDEIRLGSLHPTRDFSFVSDIVDGFASVLGAPRAIGRVTNLGSGFEISIADLAQLVGEVMGRTVRVAADPARVRPPKSEVERLLADNSMARELLGWAPRYAGRDGLRRGLAETAAWLARHFDKSKAALYNV